MDRREVVLEIIEKNPGIRFNEIMRMSNIRNGTLSHYVKKLEEEKSIELKEHQELHAYTLQAYQKRRLKFANI